tara:strand:+ start:48 stop:554 length:507 start_codon:yes stop_codon:yes gene_type:complete
MNKFNEGKIYKIVDYTGENKPYIGSTIQSLKKRLRGHERDSMNPVVNCASKPLILNNNYEIQLIENFPCESFSQLREREQYHMDNIECCNISRAYTSQQQKKDISKLYYETNKDDLLKKKREYDSVYHKCECGGGYSMSHRARHMNSNKCKNYFKNKNLDNSINDNSP